MVVSETVDVVIHSTHEAALKIGGIGAVLDGLLTARGYLRKIRRTVLVGPFYSNDAVFMERLHSPRTGLKMCYSSMDGISGNDALSLRLAEIEADYHVRIIYGTRLFGDVEHEVILIDPTGADDAHKNNFKFRLWERFGLQSDRYDNNWEYDFYIRLAEPQYMALEAVLGEDMNASRKVIMAHEFMGVPLCLACELYRPGAFCRVYYAHEVPPARPVVENRLGHDTMFYNVMRLAQREMVAFPQIFGDQSFFFKYALLEAASDFPAIFAVGDWVVDELRFLGSRFATKAIDLVYNGIPTESVSQERKLASLERMRQYAYNLLGRKPDYIFTHVARLVPSKGFWRDLLVLEKLEPIMQACGRSAVFFILASAWGSGRRSEDIRRMEKEYGWPVVHREVEPDLSGHEIPLYLAITKFNEKSKAIKAVLVNQFGWDTERCGERMPKDMSFNDIRIGSDLEFGQSIYEPFGIAQFEPLPYGALCVVSSACGCVGFAKRAGADTNGNVIVADYITLPPYLLTHKWQEAVQIDQETRTLVEQYRAQEAAQQIAHALPKTDTDRAHLLQRGYTLGTRMSWEVVVADYMLPALARALHTLS